ncbi:MAG TPA: type IV pilus modification protein PilV [Rudaea sp.]|nr:type IV pilus modification protein PilV [Rudaea sp.]
MKTKRSLSIGAHRFTFSGGFTLLEVLIALLVFSLGLIGVAALLVVSVRTNHSAYLRTQASFLAQSMADRMRANNLGVWKNNYKGTYTSATAGTTAATCLKSTSCSPAQIATRDTLIWSNQLASFLPDPSATIDCPTPAKVPNANVLTELPPFTGQCTIDVTWNESSLETGAAAGTTTLSWVFQP